MSDFNWNPPFPGGRHFMTRLTPKPPQKPPPASKGLGITLGDLLRARDKKKEPKKP